MQKLGFKESAQLNGRKLKFPSWRLHRKLARLEAAAKEGKGNLAPLLQGLLDQAPVYAKVAGEKSTGAAPAAP